MLEKIGAMQVKCFNTQPPEGGWSAAGVGASIYQGFNTQPPEGGWIKNNVLERNGHEFQHTAARRRLVAAKAMEKFATPVSTHSRPKAAGNKRSDGFSAYYCFNTQPPEGGWN